MPAIIAGVIAIILWFSNMYILGGMNATERGTYGDMFGAVNSIFSGFAFVGIVYAIYLQRKEIELAKLELSETKKILDEQSKNIDAQNNEFRRQSFDNKFFQLLDLLQSVVQNMALPTNPGNPRTEYKGKDFFLEYYRNFYSHKSHRESRGIVDVLVNYDSLYQTQRSDLGHYFRVLYNLFKFVDQSDIEEKRFYTNIIRAQLSDYEIVILFLNGLTVSGDKFKPLIERYSLLKMLDEILIRDMIILKDNYEQSAFGL